MNPKKIITTVRRLADLREKLLAGDLSPKGAWIHEYTRRRTLADGTKAEYYYAKWQASEEIFKRNPKKRARPIKPNKNKKHTTHQHIGRIGSNHGLGVEEGVKEAYIAWENRKKLEEIEKVLLQVQSVLNSSEASKL